MMSTGTKQSAVPTFVAVVIAAALIIAGANFLSLPSRGDNDDDEQAFVDIEADWSPGREIEVFWVVGPNSGNKYFESGDKPRFGLRRVAQKGWEVAVVVTPYDNEGTISCSISVNEEMQIDFQVSGSAPCEADLIV